MADELELVYGEPIEEEPRKARTRWGLWDAIFGRKPLQPVDQKTFDLEIPQEAEVFLEDLGLPDTLLQESAGEVYLGELLEIPPEEAGALLDPIRKEDPGWAKGLSEVGPNWQAGWLDLQVGQMLYQRLLLTLQLNSKDPKKKSAAVEGIQAIDAQVAELEGGRPEVTERSQQGLFWRALSSMASMAPIMLKGMEKGAQQGLVTGAGAAGMVALLGQAGPQVVLPEELLTVPAAFATAFGIGASTGSAQFIMQVEAGLSLKEMLDEGIDPNIAAAASLGVGIINSLLEVVQIGDIMKSIPGVDAMIRKATGQATKAIIKSGVLKGLARGALQGVKHTAIETAQEVAQESTNIVFMEFAKILTNELNQVQMRPGGRGVPAKKIDPATIQEIIQRLKDTAIDSALGFGIMQAPMVAARTVAGGGTALELGSAIAERKPTLDVEPLDVEQKSAYTGRGEENVGPTAGQAEGTRPGGTAQGQPSTQEYSGGYRPGPRIITPEGTGRLAGDLVGPEQVQQQWVPTPEATTQLESQKVDTTRAVIELKSDTAKETFRAAISQAKAENRFGSSVYVYDAEEYAGMKLFLASDGKTGVAVKPDGDLVSVFNTARNPDRKSSIGSFLLTAIQNGGNHLDAFDTTLPRLYEQYGFKVVARLPWDETQAPAGWDKETFKDFNGGEPDVVFMTYDGGDPNTLWQRIGTFPEQDISAIPYSDSYDEAVAAQKAAMAKTEPAVEVSKIEKPAPPKLSQVLSEATTEIRAAVEEQPLTIEGETFSAPEVTAARKETKRLSVEEIAREVEEQKYEDPEVVALEKEMESLILTDLAQQVREGKSVDKTLLKALQAGKETGKVVAEEIKDEAISQLREAQKTKVQELRAQQKERLTAQRKTQRESLLRKAMKERARKYVKKLAKVIKKAQDPVVGIAYEYAEAMRALASEIDPAFRGERVLRRRQAVLDFVKRHPEQAAQVPKRVMEMAQKKSLNELTVEDLEATVVALKKMEKLGRKKRVLQLRQEKKLRQEELAKVVNEAKMGKEPIEVEGKGIATLKKEGRHHLLHGLAVWFQRPQRIIDHIGGGEATFKGENFNSLWNRAQRIMNEQITGKDERYAAGEAKMKELGIDQGWLSKKVKIGNITYTQGELLGMYAGSQNELSRAAILLGNELTEKQMDAFIEKLPAEGRAWADWIIGEYEKNRQRLQEAHISYTNKPFYVEENYTPLRYLDAIYTTMKEELGQELLEREGLHKAYAAHGFTISRIKKIPKEFRRQVNLNLTGVWLDQVSKQENYIRNARDIRMLQYIVNDRQWSEIVRQRLGSETVKVMREWVNRVVNPNYYKVYDAANKVSSMLRRNAALGYLVANVTTVLKQAPSWALALSDVGPRLITSSMLAPFQAGKIIDRMHRLSPQMRHRSIMRELEELKVMDANLYQKMQKEVGRWGMLPIYAMDKAIVTLVWNAQLEKSMAAGLSEMEAAMEADNVVQRTQPAAAPKDQAQIFVSGEATAWLTMFGNQINQIWNMVSYDIPRRFVGGIRKGDAKQVLQAMVGLMGITLSGAGIWMITNRRLPEDKDDLKDMLLETYLNTAPIVGRYLVQAMHGFMDATIPVLDQIANLGYAIFAKTYWRNKLNKMLEAFAVLGGFPYSQTRRVIRAIQREDVRELVGGPPKR